MNRRPASRSFSRRAISVSRAACGASACLPLHVTPPAAAVRAGSQYYHTALGLEEALQGALACANAQTGAEKPQVGIPDAALRGERRAATTVEMDPRGVSEQEKIERSLVLERDAREHSPLVKSTSGYALTFLLNGSNVVYDRTCLADTLGQRLSSPKQHDRQINADLLSTDFADLTDLIWHNRTQKASAKSA